MLTIDPDQTLKKINFFSENQYEFYTGLRLMNYK